jgi:hypothetical protein
MTKTMCHNKKRVKNTKKKFTRKTKRTLRRHKKRHNRKTYKGGNCRSNPIKYASYPLSDSGGSLMELPQSTQLGGSGMLTKLMPQDLVNFGRGIQGGAIGIFNGWNGVETQPSNNPLPTSQPIDNNYNYIGRKLPIDVIGIHNKAGNKVAGI